jgi:hypothetical protein
VPSCPWRLLESLASHAERTVTPCVAEVAGGGGAIGCASAVVVVSAEGRLTKLEGNGELPAGPDGGTGAANGGGIGTGAAWGRGGARVFVVLVDVPEAQAG